MVRFLPFLISLALSVYALFSCIQTPDEDVPHLPKLVWIVLIVFVPFVGPIVWLLMLRNQLGRRDRAARQPKPGPRPRPVAPDDDPDFLKSLDRFRDPRTTVKPPEPPKDPEAQSESLSEPDEEPGPKKPQKPQPKRPEDENTSPEPDDGKA